MLIKHGSEPDTPCLKAFSTSDMKSSGATIVCEPSATSMWVSIFMFDASRSFMRSMYETMKSASERSVTISDWLSYSVWRSSFDSCSTAL